MCSLTSPQRRSFWEKAKETGNPSSTKSTIPSDFWEEQASHHRNNTQDRDEFYEQESTRKGAKYIL